MKLVDLLAERHSWDEDQTIYVVEPWTIDAEAIMSNVSPDTTDPVVRSGQSYAYFIEGFIARDFLDDLGALEEQVSAAHCERLIFYATNDA